MLDTSRVLYPIQLAFFVANERFLSLGFEATKMSFGIVSAIHEDSSMKFSISFKFNEVT